MGSSFGWVGKVFDQVRASVVNLHGKSTVSFRDSQQVTHFGRHSDYPMRRSDQDLHFETIRDVGYGFRAPHGPGVVTPYTGTSWAEEGTGWGQGGTWLPGPSWGSKACISGAMGTNWGPAR